MNTRARRYPNNPQRRVTAKDQQKSFNRPRPEPALRRRRLRSAARYNDLSPSAIPRLAQSSRDRRELEVIAINELSLQSYAVAVA
jgi:hypothetical protein